MWRALFMAIGIVLCLIGLECMVVDKAVLAQPGQDDPLLELAGYGMASSSGPREIEPPEWAPWSCISAGSVVLLYAALLKKSSEG